MKIIYTLCLLIAMGVGHISGALIMNMRTNTAILQAYQMGHQDAVDTFIMPNATIVIDGKKYKITEGE